MSDRLRTVQHSADLEASPETVFAWVSEPPRLARWMTGLRAIEHGRLAPDAVGHGFVLVRQIGGHERRFPGIVTEWDPPRQVTWSILQDQLTVQRRASLEPIGNGTRLTLEVSLTPATTLARLGLAWFRHETSGRLRQDLDALDAQLRES